MKRLFLMIVLVMLVYMVAASHRRARRVSVSPSPPAHWAEFRHRHDRDAGDRLANEVRDEVRQAVHRVRTEVRQAVDEVRHEVRQVFDGDDDSRSRRNPSLEEADGLPVPIVPGTRVTLAQTKPPAPPIAPAPPAPPAPRARPAAPAVPAPKVAEPVSPSETHIIIVKGQISATEERAKADVRNALRDRIADWLDSEVSGSWTPPSRLIDSMIVETRIDPVVKEYGTLYVAELKVDFSPQRRQVLVDVYHREQVQHRLVAMGGVLGFVLICLAAISGYIRTDEATKGYYTNRLRMVTAAGVGAAGVIIYQMLA
jgi:hypothetical protein